MKLQKFTFCLLSPLILLSGCNLDLLHNYDREQSDNTLKIGEKTEIKSGEMAVNSLLGLSLTAEIIEDSRCPEGVMCFWEGNAAVRFDLTTKNGHYNFTLDTHRPFSGHFKNDTIIEGLQYWLTDVLPYPVYGAEPTTEPTVKVVAGGRLMANSRWQLIRIENKTAGRVNIYPQENEPYIVYFKDNKTVEFPLNCNISQGNYCVGKDGSIAFDGFFPCTEKYCTGLYEWEMSVAENLLKSTKFMIHSGQLTIDCEDNRLIFYMK